MISDTVSDAMGEIFDYLIDNPSDEEGQASDKESLESDPDWFLHPDNLAYLRELESHYDSRLNGKLVTLLQLMREVRMILDASPTRAT